MCVYTCTVYDLDTLWRSGVHVYFRAYSPQMTISICVCLCIHTSYVYACIYTGIYIYIYRILGLLVALGVSVSVCDFAVICLFVCVSL